MENVITKSKRGRKPKPVEVKKQIVGVYMTETQKNFFVGLAGKEKAELSPFLLKSLLERFKSNVS